MTDFRTEILEAIGEEVLLSEGVQLLMTYSQLQEQAMAPEEAVAVLALERAYDALDWTEDLVGELPGYSVDSFLEAATDFVIAALDYASEQVSEHGADAVIDRVNRFSGCGDCANCRKSNEGYLGGMYL